MKKRFARLFLLLVLCLSGLSGGCQRAPEVRIGFIAQISGPYAYVGQAARLALEDWVKTINENGGIRGYRVKLITYDSQHEVDRAVAAAKRLVEKDQVVGIIGPEWSGAAIPIAAYADAVQIPVIATSATNMRVTVNEENQLHPYMFRICFVDADQGYALANFAYSELGKRSAGFITDSTQIYSVGLQHYFEHYFTELGGEIVSREGYQITTTDFTTQIHNAAASQPDILVIPTATYRDAAAIALQARQMGQNFVYLGADGWIADELLTTAGEALDGAYLSTGMFTGQEMFQEFNAQFEAAHGIRPSIFAYYALDAMYAFEHAIGQAFDKTGQPEPAAIRDALENMQEVPAFTGFISMDPATHNPRGKSILILQIKDGQYRVVKTYSP